MEQIMQQRALWEKQRQQALRKEAGNDSETIQQLVKIARQAEIAKPQIQADGNYDNACPVCLGNYRNPVAGECGHLMCKECYDKLPQKKCPICCALLGDMRPIFGINLVDEDEAQEIVQKSVDEQRRSLDARLKMAQQGFAEAQKQKDAFTKVQETYLKARLTLSQKAEQIRMEIDALDVEYAQAKDKAVSSAQRLSVLSDLVASLEGERRKLEFVAK